MASVPSIHLAAWQAVLRVHAQVTAAADAALAREGLPPLSWYDVLWTLHEAPAAKLRMSEIADGLTISRSTFSRLAERLATAGLLRFEPDPADGRGRFALLTEDGREMLRRMWPVYARTLEEAFVPLLEPRDAARVASALRPGRPTATRGASRAAAR